MYECEWCFRERPVAIDLKLEQEYSNLEILEFFKNHGITLGLSKRPAKAPLNELKGIIGRKRARWQWLLRGIPQEMGQTEKERIYGKENNSHNNSTCKPP